MIILDNFHYQKIAALLEEAIGEDGYYSGSIDYTYENLDCRLTISVLVYREDYTFGCEGYPFSMSCIVNLSPIWWDFVAFGECENEENDFDFEQLKYEICNR